MNFDFTELSRIAEFMDSAGLSYFEYGSESAKIVLKKAEAPPALAAPPRSKEGSPLLEEELRQDYAVVTSPVVGTVYLTDAGGAQIVAVGSEVRSGDVLCRIEAMKMFSDIKSPCAGKIVAILAAEGELAEYEMPLFHIERAHD